MKKMLLFFPMLLVVTLIFLSTGCKQKNGGELTHTNGYFPVEACIEDVLPSVVMHKGVIWVKVSYINLSSKHDTAMVNLGRYPESFFKKGDSLKFYIHPDSPAELHFRKKDLMKGNRSSTRQNGIMK